MNGMAPYALIIVVALGAATSRICILILLYYRQTPLLDPHKNGKQATRTEAESEWVR